MRPGQRSGQVDDNHIGEEILHPVTLGELPQLSRDTILTQVLNIGFAGRVGVQSDLEQLNQSGLSYVSLSEDRPHG